MAFKRAQKPKLKPSIMLQLPHTYRRELREMAARLFAAYSMASGAAKHRMIALPKGVVPGFRRDYVEQVLQAAGYLPKVQPKLSKRSQAKIEAKLAHIEAVESDPTRGLTNYELIRFNEMRRRFPKEEVGKLRSFVVGCRAEIRAHA